MPKIKVLPRLPSLLIQIAVADLRKAEKDKRFKVDMSIFHTTRSQNDKVCCVCFGGAVMAGTLKCGPELNELAAFAKIGKINKQQIYALDCARCYNAVGCVSAVTGHDADQSQVPLHAALRGISIKYQSAPRYGNDPTGFKKAVLRFAKDLAALGF